jgi:proline dehydrogenase
MRAALDEIVTRVAADVAHGSWDALIAQASGNRVTVNAGAEAGLKPGDRLSVERIVAKLTDPVNNRVLKVERAQLGTIRLTEIAQAYADGVVEGSTAGTLQRGDNRTATGLRSLV